MDKATARSRSPEREGDIVFCTLDAVYPLRKTNDPRGRRADCVQSKCRGPTSQASRTKTQIWLGFKDQAVTARGPDAKKLTFDPQQGT